jgi:2-oxoglutarate dehydrogenase E2 component (dihydrolipoamide succinyltransferase)
VDKEIGLVDLLVPLEQEGTKAAVLGWLKAVGEAVAADEPIVELETDKVAVEVAAPVAGVLAEQILAKDEEAAPGAVLGRIRVTESVAAAPADGPTASAPAASAPRDLGELRHSPSVRRQLAASGLDPRDLAGTGRGGRLTRQDVVEAAARRGSEASADAGVRRIPHDRMRRRIAEHMSHSLATAPHVTAVFEADFSAVTAHRQAQARGAAPTYSAYMVVAAAKAMTAAPAVNSRWHEDHLEIFSEVNVGVGVALGEKGLVVPVIHGAQALTLEAIADRLRDLTERARAGRLAPADVSGGTFSISNHGVSGSLIAAPIIINQPQSAILGVGKLEKRVVAREVDGIDTIQIRPMAFVSLTIDHRVIDAAQTNAWLSRFVEVLETWPAG